MDQGLIAVVILATIGLIGGGITRMCLAHAERKLRIKNESRSPAGIDSFQSEIEAVRAEVARLRDTSTQYDISIQHTLEEVQQRLSRLEGKRSGVLPPANVEETSQQTVGLGNK